MSAKLCKIFLILGIAAILVAIPLFWLYWSQPQKLEADFLDVGQGDAILIKTPAGQNVLIDGGPDKTVVRRLSENLAWWDKEIDLMILTHPHDDHVTGLIEVLKRYQVKKILYTGVTHNAPNYLSWLKLVRDKKVPLEIVDRAQTIALGENTRLEILYPNSSLLNRAIKDLNQSSIISKLIYGQKKILLTGDAGAEVEDALIAAGVDLPADVLKVGHHGSSYSTGEAFLKLVRPDIAVIAVGRDNQFGHPSLRTIKRIERQGAKIYRTDLEGTIRLASDGRKIIKK
ncbi:MAG: ComEC/Rec2 family competence protein [Patescibacteria group bacterium]|nr:ComEC/Rec2 family competence protein [Patescibacteria group bacterium]